MTNPTQPTSLEQFEKDLIRFIKNHPYTKQETNGELTIVDKPQEDLLTISLQTPNGDYEELIIRLNKIA